LGLPVWRRLSQRRVAAGLSCRRRTRDRVAPSGCDQQQGAIRLPGRLVLDGAGHHIAAALTTLVCLPPYAPEHSPIENVWEYLRGNKLAIIIFDDYDDIVDKNLRRMELL
jgi:hypothetical protein